eukprot:11226699-Lingulodinium_polyedra.AAC.1
MTISGNGHSLAKQLFEELLPPRWGQVMVGDAANTPRFVQRPINDKSLANHCLLLLLPLYKSMAEF